MENNSNQGTSRCSTQNYLFAESKMSSLLLVASASGSQRLPVNLRSNFLRSDDPNEEVLLITKLGYESFCAHRTQIVLYLQSIDPAILKRVNFIYCDLRIGNYIQILSHLSDIVELDFHMCKIHLKQRDDDIQAIAMLEKLVTFQVNCHRDTDDTHQWLELTSRILGGSTSMEDIRLHLRLPEGLDDRYEDIRSIVARQQRLKILYIGDNHFFDGELNNPEFQLRSFFMPVNESHFTGDQLRNFHAFIETQYEMSLLECDVAVDFNRRMTKKIVTVVNSLDMQAFRREYRGMSQNPHVKQLIAIFFGGNIEEHGEIVDTLVNIYPRLENIEFDYNMINEKTNMVLLTPVNKLKNLSRISFEGMSNRQISHVKVPTLKSVEISFDDEDIESLNRFITRNTQMEGMKLLVDMEDYESLMPGLYLFVEFALRILSNLKKLNVKFDSFEELPIERAWLQQMINMYAQHDEFELTIDFVNDDRESEVFVKTN